MEVFNVSNLFQEVSQIVSFGESCKLRRIM